MQILALTDGGRQPELRKVATLGRTSCVSANDSHDAVRGATWRSDPKGVPTSPRGRVYNVEPARASLSCSVAALLATCGAPPLAPRPDNTATTGGQPTEHPQICLSLVASRRSLHGVCS